MTAYRKHQLAYILVDILSSLLVWVAFLGFRWLVYEGKVFSVDTILVPMFDFYRPLVLYPLGCLVVYYLSGYYLRPIRKEYGKEFRLTFISALLIALGAFFVIIIDDVVTSYHRYLTSLLVLVVLQFVLSYIPRLIVTWINHRASATRRYIISSVQDVDAFLAEQAQTPYDEVIIDLDEQASEKEIYSLINRLYPHDVEIAIRPRLYDMLTGAARISEVGDIPLVHITEHKMSDYELCMKRACDVFFSALALVLLSPIYIVVYTGLELLGGTSYLSTRAHRSAWPCFSDSEVPYDDDSCGRRHASTQCR